MRSYIFKLIISIGCIAFLLSCTTEPDIEKRDTSNKQTKTIITDSLRFVNQDFISYSPDAKAGKAVYVPVYSHIYQQSAKRIFNLTATLSIRNTDLNRPITLSKVFYYDSNGKLVQKYLEEPRKINPLSSISYVVEEEDLRGGVGANYLVLWESEHIVTEPVIEAVMISTAQSQGISFISKGRTIHSLK